ncbi:putative butyrate kinase [Geomonas limicola]|uniref:Probable butyrate kinase n=1 Tax=Geomonas limicola TaxID=2740186 RepID=A0A6V8NCY8_9BACT|nr:butyrate kinase [Geomonas limicola]GFO70498.1 putative butyrate kinase [Geomonas limicola]
MKILAIDPGSTSTKIGVLHEGRTLKANLEHPRAEIDRFVRVGDQFAFRLECIDRYLESQGLSEVAFDAVVGRGGLLRPVEGGVYLVNDALAHDLSVGVSGEHAANLGGILARSVAQRTGAPAFVVDPPVLDELWPVARVSGLSGIERRSMFHALNQKAAARDVAQELGRPYQEINLIVVHMGGGITAGAHCKGRVVDVNNGLNGDGPLAPERTGGLPVVGVLELLERGVYTIPELKALIARKGGIYSYLGTVDLREVENRMAGGDAEARLIFDALVYQIAKEVGGLAAALDGAVDGIVLTGGLAHSKELVAALSAKVGFIAPLFLRPGEFELEALIGGALRVLTRLEEPRVYPGREA